MLELPDILGYITGGERCAAGHVQAAAAARPAVVPPGRPFELLVILQNAADAHVEAALTLHLPKNFAAPQPQLVVSLSAGEVCCARFPVAARAGTPDSEHKLGVEIETRAAGKVERLRGAAGGALVTPAALPEALREQLEGLTPLRYAVAKRLGRNLIDVPLSVSAHGSTHPVKPQPESVSLWTLGELDERALLRRYAEPFKNRIIGQIRRQHSLMPLGQMTQKRFSEAGYPLKTVETLLIAKLLALILEYAAPTFTGHSPLDAKHYNLQPLLTGSDKLEDAPRWFRGFLHTLGRHENALAQPLLAIMRLHYDDLLRDAVDLAFQLVETNTGENVGSEAEMADYRERILEALNNRGMLRFAYVYMPLVLGGMTINERVTLENENFIESMRQMWAVLDERRAECDDDTLPVVDLAEQVVERALQTYGLRRSSL